MNYDDYSDDTNTTDFPCTYRVQPRTTYVSAPCGSGKTHALIQHFSLYFKHQRTGTYHAIYVAPSVDLLNSTLKELEKVALPQHRLTIISSRDGSGSQTVQSRITDYLNDELTYTDSSILLITHQAFLDLGSSRPNGHRWEVFVDEVPQIQQVYDLNFPVTGQILQQVLSQHLEAKPFKGNLCRVVPHSRKNLQQLLDENDSGLEGIRDLLEKVLSYQYEVFAKTDFFTRVIERRDPIGDTDVRTNFLILPDPKTFAGCCILGANFEKSLLNQFLVLNGHNLTPHPELSKNLRYNDYPRTVGSRLRVAYCLEKNRYSKTIRDRQTTDCRPVQQAIDEEVCAVLEGKPFLLLTNKDDRTTLLRHPGHKRVPHNSEGLNDFAEYKAVVLMSALNLSPPAMSMLVEYGFRPPIIRHSVLLEKLHQTLMRTNLRDPHSSEPVWCFVPDKQSAFEISHLVGCADVSRLGSIELMREDAPDRPPPLSQVQKNNRSSARKTQQKLLLPSEPLEPIDQEDVESTLPYDLKDIRDQGNQNTTISGEQFKYDTGKIFVDFTMQEQVNPHKPEHLIYKHLPLREFIKDFRKLSRQLISEKEEAALFNPSVYRSAQFGESVKSNATFEKASFIVLDFDGGTVSIEGFIRTFWTDAGAATKRSFIIHNTFRTSPEEPNRFRVILPLKQAVYSTEVYQSIWDDLKGTLERAGYERAGLDKNSRTPILSYYVPSTNRHYPQQHFFEAFGMNKREFKRYALDPEPYLYAHLVQETQAWIASQPAELSVGVQAWIEAEKAKLMGMRENRHDPFFRFAVRLKGLGLSFPEIDGHLHQVAGLDPKMRKKARDNMKSLRRYSRGSY